MVVSTVWWFLVGSSSTHGAPLRAQPFVKVGAVPHGVGATAADNSVPVSRGEWGWSKVDRNGRRSGQPPKVLLK